MEMKRPMPPTVAKMANDRMLMIPARPPLLAPALVLVRALQTQAEVVHKAVNKFIRQRLSGSAVHCTLRAAAQCPAPVCWGWQMATITWLCGWCHTLQRRKISQKSRLQRPGLTSHTTANTVWR